MTHVALRQVMLLAFLVLVTACESQPIAPDVERSARWSSETLSSFPTCSAIERCHVVFVTSQGLYYNAFVQIDPLSMGGEFQLLSNGRTEFGPGQVGYIGGRWWEDLNHNGKQDAGDHFFFSPLALPGRIIP